MTLPKPPLVFILSSSLEEVQVHLESLFPTFTKKGPLMMGSLKDFLDLDLGTLTKAYVPTNEGFTIPCKEVVSQCLGYGVSLEFLDVCEAPSALRTALRSILTDKFTINDVVHGLSEALEVPLIHVLENCFE
jgi:hypothetical protein